MSGRTRPVEFRLTQIESLLRGLKIERKKLCAALQKDLGREEFASWFYEVALVEQECEHVIKKLKEWVLPKEIPTAFLSSPGRSKIVYEPLGVVAVMGSWNFPLLTTIAPLVYVIAAGNCAVMKPSEITSHSLHAMKNLFKTYLDNACYICIEGKVQVAKTIPLRKFDGICFTGSTEKGKLVAEAAAKNLIPCVLELGGKSPIIVDKGSDVDFAAKKIAFGRFMNAG
jgi:aldehyde dehydrogenase (NAD+)